jgi:hypothetical protein
MVSLFPRSLNTSTDAAPSLLSAYPIKLKAVPTVEPKLQGRWYHPRKTPIKSQLASYVLWYKAAAGSATILL